MPLPIAFSIADRRRLAGKKPRSDPERDGSRTSALTKAKMAIRNKKPPVHGVAVTGTARDPLEMHQQHPLYNAANKRVLD